MPAARILVCRILVRAFAAAAVAAPACGAALLVPALGAHGTAPTLTTITSVASAPEPGGTSPPTTTTPTPAPAVPPNPCDSEVLHLRCPDLIMSAPSEMHLDRTTIAGRVLLRATSSVDNIGTGPLELRASRSGGRWRVYQAIYDRRGGEHRFRTAARLVYKHVPGDRYGYGYVGAASYWKVRHVAAFQLWSVDTRMQRQTLVRSGPKVDYCLRDYLRTHPSPRSPRLPFYPECSEDAGITHDRLGTSVGWSDIYPYGYPEQWIDVTGLRGRFAFVQIADPDGLWNEARIANNASETFVALPSGRILGHRVGVAPPNPGAPRAG